MAIHFDKTTKTFYLDGKSTTYAFYINNLGYAEHLYYGKSIGHDPIIYTRAHNFGSADATHPGGDKTNGISSYNRMGTELSFFGTSDYREPCVLVQDPEGDRLTELLYCGYEILDEKPRISGMPSMRGKETLVLHLFDEVKGFGADLYYTVYDDCDIIARRIVYKNCSENTVSLLRAYSFSMTLPENNYDALTLWGGWAKKDR
jgi:alpha-galactosidase